MHKSYSIDLYIYHKVKMGRSELWDIKMIYIHVYKDDFT